MSNAVSTCSMIVTLILTSAGLSAEANIDLPDADTLRCHIDACFARYRDAEPQDRVRAFDDLEGLVRLEADHIELDGQKLAWSCLRKRKLTNAEQRRTVEGLEGLLIRVLSAEPLDREGRPAFSPEAARRLIDHGTLRIL